MNPFKPADPKKKAEAAVVAARADRDGLLVRLARAETAVAEQRDKPRKLARGGAEDAELDAVESDMRVKEDRVRTLTAAIGDVEKDIAALEREINGIIDQRMRADTAQAIGMMARKIEDVAAEYADVALRFENAVRAVALISLEAGPVAAFIESARVQLPPSTASLLVELGQRAAAVINGSARPSLPQPAPEPVRLKVVPAPTKEVVAIKNFKFKGLDGKLVVVGRTHRASLPDALAERAIASRFALPFSDPRVRNLINTATNGAVLPDATNCEWLTLDDARPEEAPKRAGPAITASSPFEVYDRGPGFTMRVPVEPVAVGARSMPTGGEET